MTNAFGYAYSRREEGCSASQCTRSKAIDPNRDFPYLRKGSECMESQTARVVNELFHEHVFRTSISFHGGCRALAFEWGSDDYAFNCNGHLCSYEAPDNTAQRSIGDKMRLAAGFDSPGKYWYDTYGPMTDTVYPVKGGMEDWSYAAGWETEGAVKPCTPDTYPFAPKYEASRTSGRRDNVACLMYLAETDDKKQPALVTYGNEDEMTSSGGGHIPRNAKMAWKAAELIEGQVIVNEVKHFDGEGAQLSASKDVGMDWADILSSSRGGLGLKGGDEIELHVNGVGCELMSNLHLFEFDNCHADESVESLEQAIQSGDGRLHVLASMEGPFNCTSMSFWSEGVPNAAEERQVVLRGKLKGLHRNPSCIFLSSRFDQHWSRQVNPHPHVAPRSHVARQRLDSSYRTSVVDMDGRQHIVRGSVDVIFPTRLVEFQVVSTDGSESKNVHRSRLPRLLPVGRNPRLPDVVSSNNLALTSVNITMDILANCKDAFSTKRPLLSSADETTPQKTASSSKHNPWPSPIKSSSTITSVALNFNATSQLVTMTSKFPSALPLGIYFLSIHSPPTTALDFCTLSAPPSFINPASLASSSQVSNNQTKTISFNLPASWLSSFPSSIASLQGLSAAVSYFPPAFSSHTKTLAELSGLSATAAVGSSTIPIIDSSSSDLTLAHSLSAQQSATYSCALKGLADRIAPTRRSEGKNAAQVAIKSTYLGMIWLSRLARPTTSAGDTTNMSHLTVNAVRCAGLYKSTKSEQILKESSETPFEIKIHLAPSCCSLDAIDIQFPPLTVADTLLNPYHARGHVSIPPECEVCLFAAIVSAHISGISNTDAPTNDAHELEDNYIDNTYSNSECVLLSDSVLGPLTPEGMSSALTPQDVIDIVCPLRSQSDFSKEHLQIGLVGSLTLSLVSLVSAALAYLVCLRFSASKYVGGEDPSFQDDETDTVDEEDENDLMNNKNNKSHRHKFKGSHSSSPSQSRSASSRGYSSTEDEDDDATPSSDHQRSQYLEVGAGGRSKFSDSSVSSYHPLMKTSS